MNKRYQKLCPNCHKDITLSKTAYLYAKKTPTWTCQKCYVHSPRNNRYLKMPYKNKDKQIQAQHESYLRHKNDPQWCKDRAEKCAKWKATHAERVIETRKKYYLKQKESKVMNDNETFYLEINAQIRAGKKPLDKLPPELQEKWWNCFNKHISDKMESLKHKRGYEFLEPPISDNSVSKEEGA